MPHESQRWIIPHMPADEQLLAAVGRVALRHGYLDLMLKRIVMQLAELNSNEAESALQFESSSALRDLARKLSSRRFGRAAVATLKTKALLADCELATEKRNRLIHRDWALDTQFDQVMLMSAYRQEHWPVPEAAELNDLADSIYALARRCEDALTAGGFLHTAMAEVSTKESIRALKTE